MLIPATTAMRVVVAESAPSRSKIRMVASRIALTVARERDCLGSFREVVRPGRLLMEIRGEGESTRLPFIDIMQSEQEAKQTTSSPLDRAVAIEPVEGSMRPRFSADYRTLLWSFVLFPLLPAACYASPSIAP